jgi:hypothetical protein
MHLRKSSWQNPAVLIVIFLLIVSVRFNRNDLLVKRSLGDARYYIENVKFFRGEKISYGLQAPFNERLLVTILASPLPFDPMTSINIVNVLFLSLSLFYFFKTLKLLVPDQDFVWAGLYMFVISFPTFYYATIGYVDSGVLLMIFVGLYAIYSQKYILFLSAIALGTLAKEGIVLLIPVAAAFGYVFQNRKWYLYALAGLAIYLVIWGLVKHNIPNSEGYTPVLFWQPISWRLQDNLTRINTYVSSVLSFGIPGFLCCYFIIKYPTALLARWKEDLPLWLGAIGGTGLWFYSIFSAHTDGRFFWIAYCFPILLSMIWWNSLGNPFRKTS